MKKPACACLVTVLVLLSLGSAASLQDPRQIKLLIITGDHGHDWKATTAYFKEFLPKDRIAVDVTEAPGKDLTPENLKKYDVLLLNYRDTAKGAKESPDTVWSPENKQAFLGAVRGGKGLVVYHHTSAAFLEWLEFERCIAGGWRGQGYHGPRHQFTVKVVRPALATDGRAAPPHPIIAGMPTQFLHAVDELYANSVMFPENEVLATAYSDPAKEYGTGKHEPMIWVKNYGRGRVFVNAMGHDVDAMKGLGFQTMMIRGIEWTAAGKVTHLVPAKLDAEKAGKAVSEKPGWGTIKGRIVFAGDPIPQPQLLVKRGDTSVKDFSVAAAQDIYSEELIVNANNRGVRNVIAYLAKPILIHSELSRAEGEVEMSLEACSIRPHVLAIRQGQKLIVSNSDPISQNFNFSPFKGSSSNILLPQAKAGTKSTIELTSLVADPRPVPVRCNIHAWESAFVWVFDHPYFAVTDEDGRFEIGNVPSGPVRLILWQEKRGFLEGGRNGREVEVQSGWVSALGEINLELPN